MEIAATSPCCSSTRQSVKYGTATGMGWEDAALMLAMEVDPVVAHTFFPPRSARLLARELSQDQDALARVEVDGREVDRPGAARS